MSHGALRQYAGSNMHVIGANIRGWKRLSRIRGELSREARGRLSWLDWYEAHGENARKTCRHFAISPDTFCRWLRRYDSRDLGTLESPDASGPSRVRQPTWTGALAQAVLELRERYPRWGKDKLGVLREPPRNGINAHKRLWQRPYAVRNPKRTRPRNRAIWSRWIRWKYGPSRRWS